MDGDALTLDLAPAINSIPAADWDALAGSANPFVSHAFLAALEEGQATGGDTGWESMHLVLRDADGRLVGAMPHYLKHHSYGEYIFDHSWANAFMRAGGDYYPKMLSAVPFTPATGPRFLVGDVPPDRAAQLRHALADGMVQYMDRLQLSSAHINFLPETDIAPLAAQGWMIRSSIQFHWKNDGYRDFDDFLAALSSRKRKNIRKERRKVADAGVRLLRLTGDDITAAHIDDFYRFYLSTIDRKWGGAYLTREVFHHLHASMADRILLVMAEYDGRIIGGALNFIGSDTLFGRNWGADLDIPCLHFEACYYQAIEFAIEGGLAQVEAGAQGFHKVQRGYMPATTHSAHWVAHDGFRAAIERFLAAERSGIDAEINNIEIGANPFKKG
ncbi:MAG: GNAT family N-acetyltransferase [Alphaproteobacteria bacterium]|nr:GNAT family N-acetyltransferase [Alphaproteobacteria bacterium]